MNNENDRSIADALKVLSDDQPMGGGRWLEELTQYCATLIDEWDLVSAWHWKDWPERDIRHPESGLTDIGIDVVGLSRDGRLIAIQCKARQLDEHGRGKDVTKTELDKFLAGSTASHWAERWLVVNGEIKPGRNAVSAAADKPIITINLKTALRRQKAISSRNKMQDEAVAAVIEGLCNKEDPFTGESRGKIVLPCGTGKSRIALRIIEKLTKPGQVSAILCPSIALVSQLRREFLLNKKSEFLTLAICSDQAVGGRGNHSSLDKDPTLDLGGLSRSDLFGIKVTTNPEEIRRFIDQVQNQNENYGIIFSTYQSSCQLSEALIGDDKSRKLQIMVADEAHRTAGLKPINTNIDKKIRNFTICHDREKFPCKYRLYQTATPKRYDQKENDRWIVRSMDDKNIFGPELYSRSYVDAVENGWLTDYQIIALTVQDQEAYDLANILASRQKGQNRLTTTHFLSGLVLALVKAGELANKGVEIKSSINFMNRIEHSKEMTEALQTKEVQKWLNERLNESLSYPPSQFRLEHLDASNTVTEREKAIADLGEATTEEPFGILNVGIFGEGVDAPSLSAVGFLEPRKSPVDVIQALGRVMRTAPNKTKGYIICPIPIRQDVDAETWLRTSGPEEGWKILGDILLALRAHDERIEDKLSHLMQIYLPANSPQEVSTVVTLPTNLNDTGAPNLLEKYDSANIRRCKHLGHSGQPGEALDDIREALSDPKINSPYELKDKTGNPIFTHLNEVLPIDSKPKVEANQHIAARHVPGGTLEISETTVVRDASGKVNVKKTKELGKKMISGTVGKRDKNRVNTYRVKPITKKEKQAQRAIRERQKQEKKEFAARDLFVRLNPDQIGIHTNLLTRSGLKRDRLERDANILEDCVREARRYMIDDGLKPILDEHFMLPKNHKGADGCMIASLLLMNACMLHQRIAEGSWLSNINGLDRVINSPDTTQAIYVLWNRITRHDFLPVIEPAIEVIEAIQITGKKSGLDNAITHLAEQAIHIASHYADLGSDHAGPLFNSVMGNQASDGAFFTRPPAGALLARIALDVANEGQTEPDWTNPDVWNEYRTVDLACGSGTLIAAILTEMKRRAKRQGANEKQLGQLQRLAVEDVIAGLDFNEVSLQLAAAQMTAGNHDVFYKKINLTKMPYGLPRSGEGDGSFRIASGTLELLGQQEILRNVNQFDLPSEELQAERIQMADRVADKKNPLLEDTIQSVKNVRIVIMNPPFTNRIKMGEKFSQKIKSALRERVDDLERKLLTCDPELDGFINATAIGPMFVALAEKCIDADNGLLAMIHPTIAFTVTSGLIERKVLAQRFHIHTLVTCHQPKNLNLSQNTNINESMIIATRYKGKKPPTRIINLDRLPMNEAEVHDLHLSMAECSNDIIPNGWGVISEWPAERIREGDWSAAVWRSPELAEAAYQFANNKNMKSLYDQGILPAETGRLLSGKYESSRQDKLGSFPIIKSKGAEGQKQIRSKPDEYWCSKVQSEMKGLDFAEVYNFTDEILDKAGYLLITSGQDTSTGRLTAIADDKPYIGFGWRPVSGISVSQAKAISVFLNSTVGRLQFLRNPGKKLIFPTYSTVAIRNIRIPDMKNKEVINLLSDCWEETADVIVPQYRDAECEVRKLWDETVARTMGWDKEWLKKLRMLLHNEPHVRAQDWQVAND